MKKSFREKLVNDKGFPRIGSLTGGMRRRYGPGTLLLPAPAEVDGLMRRVPKGKLVTLNQIRETLARRHGAAIACPILTGILARIAAGAAGEMEAEGRVRVTPYWRTLKGSGELNPKYPGGVQGQRRRLEAEGHTIRVMAERGFVEGFEAALARLQ